MELRQSTSKVIRFGPFLDSTDGVTPMPALTITQADMQLSKDVGAFAQKNAVGNATHDVDGFYTTTLDVTDTNTTAILKLQVNVATAMPVWENFDVVTQSYYDAKYAGTFNNLAATAIVSAGAINTSSGAVSNVTTIAAYTGNTPQTADHTAAIAALPTNVSIADAVWDEAIAGHVTAGTFGLMLDSTISSRMATFSYVDHSADITSILADTNELQINQGNWVTADVSAILADTNELQLNQGNWLTADVSALMLASSYVAPPTTSAIADAVWDETIASHVTAGTFGLMLDVPVSSVSGGGGITVQQVVDGVWDAASSAHTIAGSFGFFLDVPVSSVSGGGGITVQQVVDGVWDEAISSHVLAGSFGKMLDTEISSRMATFSYVDHSADITSILGDTNELQTNQGNWLTADVSAILADTNELQTNQGNWLTADVSLLMLASSYVAPPTTAAIADAVWDEAIAGHVTAGTFGLMLDSTVSSRMATFSYVDHSADITSILADTNELQLNQGNWLTADVSALMLASSYVAPPTAQAVTNAVWDEAISSHVLAGSFGKMLDTEISSRMATFSYVDHSADITSILSDTTAILIDTNELQTNQGNWIFDQADIDAIVSDMTVALNNISAAEVKAEMVAALTDPNVTAMPVTGLASQIAWLFARFAYKQEQTDALQTVNDVAGSAVSTAVVSTDGTTTTVGKHV